MRRHRISVQTAANQRYHLFFGEPVRPVGVLVDGKWVKGQVIVLRGEAGEVARITVVEEEVLQKTSLGRRLKEPRRTKESRAYLDTDLVVEVINEEKE